MIAHSESFTIPSLAARTRLDRYLSELFPDESRSQIQGWIRNGSVLVNGISVKTGYLLRTGDVIAVQRKITSPELQPQPEDIPLKIVFEDEDLAVIDKPAGLVCHAGAGITSGTLVNALLFHLGPVQTGDPLRPGIVHRLDKSTSGLLVVAKNLAAHRALSRQFKQREVKKEYLALVFGHPLQPAGTIDLPLGRDPKDRKKISVRSRRRREALTHYQVERKIGSFALLRIRIETGRTHQIRVHLAQIGHPVAGDTLYGGHRYQNLADGRLRNATRNLQRHFLHAHKFEFTHPKTEERTSFESPLPPELEDFIAQVLQAEALEK